MFESQIKYGIKRLKKHRICQGDLIRGLGFSVGGIASDNNEVDFKR